MADDLELSVKLAMETGSFQQQIQSINRSMKVVQSEFEAASSNVELYGNETDKLALKSESLSKQIELGKQKVKLFADQVKNAEKILSDSVKTNEELENKIKETSRAYEESIKTTGKSSAESKRLKADLDSLNKEYKNNKTTISDNARTLDNYKIKLNQAEKAVNNLEKGLKETDNSFSKQKKSLADIGKEADKTADKYAELKEKISGIGGKLAIGAGVVSTATIGAATAAVNTVDDLSRALNGLQASTGAADGQMEDLKNIMLTIYSDNFGESFNDISLAMKEVAQQTGLTGDQLGGLTEDALAVRDTFDFEVNESVRAANMLMKQFGMNGDEAYNLIAQGAQKGLNKNDDLLDTINEYSVHFKQLGIGADEMFNMIKNGAADGTFSIDKLGDAVKEFGIRSKDGSKSTTDAFKSLGLDANKLSKDFAKGGKVGQDAFKLVNKKLLEMKDPLKQNQIGVALWGSMWEDLGVKGITALTKTNGEISKTNDALQKINKVKYNDFSSALEGIKRQLITGLLIPLGEKLLPKLNEFATYLQENLPRIVEEITPVLDKLVDGFMYITNNLDTVIPLLEKAFGAMMALKGVSAVNSALEIFGTSIGGIGKAALGIGAATGEIAGIEGAAAGAAGAVGVAGGTTGLIGSLGAAVAAAAPFVLAAGSIALAGYGIYEGLTQEATPAVDLFAYKVEEATDRISSSNDALGNNYSGLTSDAKAAASNIDGANKEISNSYAAVSSLSTNTGTNISNGYAAVSNQAEVSVTQITDTTKKAVGAYMKLDDETKKALISLYMNSTTITNETANSMGSKYNQMGAQIKSGLDKQYSDQIKTMQDFFVKSDSMSSTNEQEALRKLQEIDNNKKTEIDKYSKQILDIYAAAAKDHRELRSDEQQQINEIQNKMRVEAVNSLSETEIESKVILERLKSYGDRITAEQASAEIKNANEAKEKSITAANEKFDKTVSTIIKMRDESHTITAQQADMLIADATRQKKESIQAAEDQRNGVVERIENMNGDIEKSVDLSTGNMLTTWGKFIKGVKSLWDDWKPNSKTFTYSLNGTEGTPIGGHIPENASGTNYWTGGLTTMNEEGYELYNLPRGSRIYNHQASEDIVIKTAEQVAKGILNKKAVNDGAKNQTIQLVVDGRILAEVVASNQKYFDRYNNRAMGGAALW